MPSLVENIKIKAKELGFAACGIVSVHALSDEKEKLNQWLNAGYHAEMDYMQRNVDMRLDPALIFPGAKSVISLIFAYKRKDYRNPDESLKISRYAKGEDYHDVLKRKMNFLLSAIQDFEPNAKGRCFVDSAPVYEKVWAQKAGLGWIGKNSLLINKDFGSYVFLGEIILNIELEPDREAKNYCGNCTACMEACPVNAIVSPGEVDSSKCISYQTIEYKGEFSDDVDLNGWIFGCDLCQECCPWNTKAPFCESEDFIPLKELDYYSTDTWLEMKEDEFQQKFKNSPVFRTRLSGMKRNVLRNKKSGGEY